MSKQQAISPMLKKKRFSPSASEKKCYICTEETQLDLI